MSIKKVRFSLEATINVTLELDVDVDIEDLPPSVFDAVQAAAKDFKPHWEITDWWSVYLEEAES